MVNEGTIKVKPERKSFLSLLRGLQFKWTLLLTIFMFTMAYVGEKLISKNVEHLVFEREKAFTHKRCASIATNSTEALHSRDLGALSSIIQKALTDPDILYVEYYTPEGQLITGMSAEHAAEPPQIDQRGGSRPISLFAKQALPVQGRSETPLFLDLVWPIFLRAMADGGGHSSKDLIGYVRIGVDLGSLHAILVSFLQHVRYAGVIIILGLIPIAFMIVRRITSPIDDLSQVVNQLSAGDFRVRSHIKRGDEIGQLAGAFNSMADALASSNDGLVKLNAELEDRVLQRTRQLKELAARDPLTGLYNRRHLGEVLTRRFAEAERYNNDLSCMMIDLDNFKQVNDMFGHETGDNLLMLTASAISSELRGADVGARFGGDEFCVLLPQTSGEQARQVGERIVQRFEDEVKSQLAGKDHAFGISVGVAGMSEMSAVHPDELIKFADQALYQAKDAGKNRIHLAESPS